MMDEMTCVHHFILPPPTGTPEESLGVCKLCGIERLMSNLYEPRSWGWGNRRPFKTSK